ncbi:MAG: IS1634 family transposase [Betaproteobacteria bacterium]
MYVRAKTVRHRDKTYEYLQLVEARREAGRNRQRVIATLGRLDQIAASGQLDRLIAGLARFSAHLRVVSVDRVDALAARTAKSWGPALVFGRLWERQGLPGILERLTAHRRFGFDLERVTFALTLQRLVAPGSDRQGAGWLESIEAPGLKTVRLHQMYRTVAALAELRDALERELFLADRDLFSGGLDLVCIDTTSTAVYRKHEHDGTLRRRGYSRDKRPDLLQVVVCLAVDRHGWPVAWEIFPGNTADRPAFEAMVAKLRERFCIGRVCVVADRGMIARDTLAYLTGHDTPWDYILGCRLRTDKTVRDGVLADTRPFRRLAEGLEVKDVRLGPRRYVVCRNPIEAERDALMREGIVERLRATLRHGPKAVVGNRGFARFLTLDKGAVAIDTAAIEADARFDGIFVLRTNTDVPADEVARLYKGLWRVERAFREVKSTLEIRPIYHQNDEACVGHLVAGFLALRLEVDLQRRLDAAGVTTPWPDLMRDLAQVHAVVVDLNGQRYRLRTDLAGAAHAAFAAAGVRPPNSVTRLGPIPSADTPDS